jgi:tetratricopeptide (TPR) repeat protein
MSQMRTAAVVVTTCAFLASGGDAGAGDAAATRARELFKQAEVHFSVGEFERALDLYKQAYKLMPLPGFLFNIGQCHRNLGQHDKALFFYRQYLLRAPQAQNREEVQKLIAICEAALRREPGPPATRPAPQPPPATASAAATQPSPPPPPPPPARRKLRPVWFFATLGAGVALVATGAICGAVALDQSAEYKKKETTIARRQELRDSGQLLARLSTVTVSVGAAALASSAVLLFFTDFRHSAELAVTPVAGGATATLGGRF